MSMSVHIAFSNGFDQFSFYHRFRNSMYSVEYVWHQSGSGPKAALMVELAGRPVMT